MTLEEFISTCRFREENGYTFVYSPKAQEYILNALEPLIAASTKSIKLKKFVTRAFNSDTFIDVLIYNKSFVINVPRHIGRS